MKDHFLIICALCVASSLAGNIKLHSCPTAAMVTQKLCDFEDIDINVCKEAKNAPCVLRKGTNATISINFKPHFSGDQLNAGLYWASPLFDVLFPGLNKNACDNTECPITADKSQNYNMNILVQRSFPKGSFDVKWKFWTDDSMLCCALFKLKVQ